MEYKFNSSPIKFESFDDLSAKEAEIYFQWYISLLSQRIDFLRGYIDKTSEKKINLDFSPDSLIPLWCWYEKTIIRNNTDISYDILRVIIDISFYFAELVVKNNPTIHWGYFTKPKNRMSVNKPVLLGFKSDMCLDPRMIVQTCTYCSIDKKNSAELYDAYRNWMKFI